MCIDSKPKRALSMTQTSRHRAESFYAMKRAPKRLEVEAALKELGLTLEAEQVNVLIRALGREKRIEAPERRKSLMQGSPAKLERQNSNLGSRVSQLDSSVHGPMVLQAGIRAEVTTAMTRSIGDWDGSRALVPR